MTCKNQGIEKICIMLEHPTTPKITSHLIKIENNKIIGSCAMGEIGLQLHVKNLNIPNIIGEMIKIGIPKQFIDYYGDEDLRDSILEWNDYTSLTKPEIAQKIRKEFGAIA